MFPEWLGDLCFADVAFRTVFGVHETPILQLVTLPVVAKVFDRIQPPSGIKSHDV